MKPSNAAERRAAAEARWESRLATSTTSTGEADLRKLQHELEVHQIELEMQNDELRTAQAEIAAGLERYTDLFDFAPVGYFTLTEDGTIRLVNLTGARLVGIERARLVGQRLGLLLPEGERNQFHQLLARAVGSASNQFSEVTLAQGGGTLLTLHLEACQDRVPGLCRMMAVDVTERRQLQAQFFRAQRMEAIGLLAGGLAHDLKNTFAPILMGIQIVGHQPQNPDVLAVLATMEASVNRGVKTIDGLLSFARGKPVSSAGFSVSGIVQELERVIRSTFPREIALRLEIPPGLGSPAGDANQIYQAIMNLCLNARDAMPGGGELTLTAENKVVAAGEQPDARTGQAKPGSYVCVEVADNGMGIPAENLDHIFEPFFTTKVPGHGTGLGLAAVQGIVTGHGGFMRVASQPGEGSTFEMWLPVAAEPSGCPTATGPTPSLRRGTGELILIVDDETPIVEVLTLLLQKYGYQVLPAGHGAQALAAYLENQSKIAAVITDVMMPGMNGRVLAQKIQQASPGLPVVFMSGLHPEILSEPRPAADWAFHLDKPFSKEELFAVLRRALDRKSSAKPL